MTEDNDTFVLRCIFEHGKKRFEEFIRNNGTTTPDISKAQHYRQLKRAYEWGYSPQLNEIVRVRDNQVVEIVESRFRGISHYGRDTIPYSLPDVSKMI